MEVLEVIKNRRSIRQQKTDLIDDETIQKILEAARWAPSWANSQCWLFIVIRDSGIKSELANTLRNGNPATDATRNSPIVIVACAEMGKAGCRDGTPVTDKGVYWYMFDVALAMQNLVLAAHALGVGTVIIGAFDAKRTAEILGVPEGFCVVAMTPLGFLAQEGRTPHRKDLSEIVFHDKYSA
ncbi:nitroreductase family protein [Chloroflexota bacterium]